MLLYDYKMRARITTTPSHIPKTLYKCLFEDKHYSIKCTGMGQKAREAKCVAGKEGLFFAAAFMLSVCGEEAGYAEGEDSGA